MYMQVMIYSGKLFDQKREVNQGQTYVHQLGGEIFGCRCTIHAKIFCHNFGFVDFFTMETAYVETLPSNQTFVPR